MSSTLKINQYEVFVSLGCSVEEQAVQQPVLFNIEISFAQKIKAEETDQLDDSINYVSLIEVIKKTSQSKPYSMIEHLCNSVTQELKKHIAGKFQGQVQVQVNKIKVPIDNLHGGAVWSCKASL